jgi:subtilase family serine protease
MRRTIEFGLFIPLALFVTGPMASAQMTRLNGNTPDRESIQANLADATPMPPDRLLKLRIVLKVRNKAAFDHLADEQNDPNSPYYHHQFSKDELSRDFGPSQNDYQSVEHWLIAQGFQIVSVDDSFLSRSIEFSGTAAQVNSTFNFTLTQSPDGRWYSNTSDPQVPPNLTEIIGYIGGLSNLGAFAPAHTASSRKSGPPSRKP